MIEASVAKGGEGMVEVGVLPQSTGAPHSIRCPREHAAQLACGSLRLLALRFLDLCASSACL